MRTRTTIPLLLLLLILAGCSSVQRADQPVSFISPLPEPSAAESDTAEADAAELNTVSIYTAVLQTLIGQDNRWPRVYVITKTDDRIGNPGEPVDSASIELSPSVQTQISTNLAGLPTQLIWVSSFQDVNVEESTGAVIGGGAIITLGNIQWIGETQVHVPGGTYYGNLGAEGGTYVAEKQTDEWKVTGMTGSRWIS